MLSSRVCSVDSAYECFERLQIRVDLLELFRSICLEASEGSQSSQSE